MSNRLDKIRDLKKNWNGYGAKPIPKKVIKIADKLLDDLDSMEDEYLYCIFPTGRKTIQVEFMFDDKSTYLEVEIGLKSTYLYIVGDDRTEGEFDNKSIHELIKTLGAKVKTYKRKVKLRTKGKFLFKSEWYSFCSAHREYDENCHMCNAGQWRNIYVQKFSSFVYDNFPKLWIWFVNL